MANKPSAKPFTPKQTADDRNLVEISSDSNIVSFEDRVYLWWQKNARLVFLLVAAIVIAIGAWFWVQWDKQAREVAVQEEFQAAQTPEQQEEFTRRHPTHTLSGVIWKQRGDQAFQEKNYQAAADYLGKASSVLTGIAHWYARLGYGASLLHTDKAKEGIEVLQALGNAGDIPPTFRAQAYWQLAVHYWSKGDYTNLEVNLDNVRELDMDGAFQHEIQSIRSLLPSNTTSKAVQ